MIDFSNKNYQEKVESWFKEHGFILCSFKGQNVFYEILDIKNWEWNTFDYKIPDYNDSKTWQDDLVHNKDLFGSL